MSSLVFLIDTTTIARGFLPDRDLDHHLSLFTRNVVLYEILCKTRTRRHSKKHRPVEDDLAQSTEILLEPQSACYWRSLIHSETTHIDTLCSGVVVWHQPHTISSEMPFGHA